MNRTRPFRQRHATGRARPAGALFDHQSKVQPIVSVFAKHEWLLALHDHVAADDYNPTLMPQLKWNDTDFLDFFAVEPTVEDYEVSYHYEIERDGLRLLLTVWQLESVIQASLFRGKAEDGLFSFAAYVRGEARFVNDKRGRCIDFEDCVVAPNRFWRIQAGDPFDQRRFPISVTIRLAIDPDIRISFEEYQSRT